MKRISEVEFRESITSWSKRSIVVSVSAWDFTLPSLEVDESKKAFGRPMREYIVELADGSHENLGFFELDPGRDCSQLIQLLLLTDNVRCVLLNPSETFFDELDEFDKRELISIADFSDRFIEKFANKHSFDLAFLYDGSEDDCPFHQISR